MNASKPLQVMSFLAIASMMGILPGCSHYERNTGRGNIPGHYIRYEMQEADRAVEAARTAGKDKTCPAEFKLAEDAKNNAYDVFRACRTEEGAALAKQATAKANALCPPLPPKVTPKVEPAPVTPPPPVPPAPTDRLMITPDSISRGQSATLSWTSQNAAKCAIQPGIGPVQLQGSMTVTPAETTAYSLICNGEGGSATSAARITVVAPVPKAEVAKPAPAPVKACIAPSLNIQFDTNKADIKPKYHDELKKLADFLVEFPTAKGVIEGHTDSVGSKALNIKLSQRRAESVRAYLIKNFKIAPERLGAKGFGPNKPVADNKTKAGKQQNRRIESSFTCEASK